ncbi:uncharacterized protein LOC131060985 [Cryptomeria japonica]|uniref:uncharacterized protein LOC131060985 n=1 Tax=Cryptomeria japonica TaxID=3369 RepID=UPI0025AB691F|nr:uncharacterized protein LOC131060985 [Cryptomeria japonica]XP_057850463.1 uncharacterized protein LOC131060985 [Cryptomeria japonica]
MEDAKMICLKDLSPAATNTVNTKFIMLEKGKPMKDGGERTCLTLVADQSASVHFQLWGNECDAFQPGDIIHLTNGIFSYHKANLVLRAGKKGRAQKIGEFIMTFVEMPNMSELRWVRDPSDQKRLIPDPTISVPPSSRIFPSIQN